MAILFVGVFCWALPRFLVCLLFLLRRTQIWLGDLRVAVVCLWVVVFVMIYGFAMWTLGSFSLTFSLLRNEPSALSAMLEKKKSGSLPQYRLASGFSAFQFTLYVSRLFHPLFFTRPAYQRGRCALVPVMPAQPRNPISRIRLRGSRVSAL